MALLRYGVLGRLAVWRGNEPVHIRGRRQHVVLALLLLHANRNVTIERLVDAVWPDLPPETARAQIQTAVWRIRKVLIGNRASDPVITSASGYRLVVEPEALDVLHVEALRQRARELGKAGRIDEAAGLLATALGYWRGAPLAGLEQAASLRAAAHRLVEQHVTTIEEWAALRLPAGHHADIVDVLTAANAEHPMREGLTELLMLAEYRRGRPAAALAAYDRLRQALADELGVEPGAALRVLQTQVLRNPAPHLRDAHADPTAAVPRQLPADIDALVGRTQALTRLDRLAPADDDSTSTVTIVAVTGTAGVGKTALAVHWAHSKADRFPDGQLYVDLCSFDSRETVSTGQALSGFLTALGMNDKAIPNAVTDRAALYRTLLAGRRMLIVLDNASSVDQVRPLLPGTPGCLVLVTSRIDLVGLIVRDGAHRIPLDRLSSDESLKLLRRLLDADRVDADAPTAARLVEQCAGLPLALRVIAERATRRPHTTLDRLTAELDTENLDILDAGEDPSATVRARFSWSYQALDSGLARLFRLLSLHPENTITAHAAAALAGNSHRQAERHLDLLADAHLIDEVEPGRYHMHNLLRAYATELAATHDAESERRAATSRLLDLSVRTATNTSIKLEHDPEQPTSADPQSNNIDTALT